jgi:hypothetical protein
MARGDTEAKLQEEVGRLRPKIPAVYDVPGMMAFDSWFYGQRGAFDFRGLEMAGWEVNYYFVSMAFAHQGLDWNRAQAMILAWNNAQDLGILPGGGDMTPAMWFAAQQGFNDELERLKADGRSGGW